MQSRHALPARSRRARVLLGAAAGLLAAATLLSCSSGNPTDPSSAPGRDDTYVFATITLLDRAEPCDPGIDCEPEFFDCVTLGPYFEGQTWSMYGDIATAGVSVDGGTARNIAITATSTTEGVGVAFEFRVPDITAAGTGVQLRGLPGSGNPCTSPSADVNGVFADLNTLCARLGRTEVQESRFTFDPCDPWDITLTSWEENGAGELQQAVRSSGNQFSPEGIMEGTFSFVGVNRQSTAAGDIQAWVQIDGCFRVNVPGDEQGVPTNPNATSSACSP